MGCGTICRTSVLIFACNRVIPFMFCVSLLQVKEAKVTEAKINEAREHYRPAAARASLLYFIMNDLNKIHPMYQFSLKVPRLLTCHVSWRPRGPSARPRFTLIPMFSASPSLHLLPVFYALCPAFIVFVTP